MTTQANTLEKVAEQMANMQEVLEKAKNDISVAIAKEALTSLHLSSEHAKKHAELTDEERELTGFVVEPLSADAYIDALLSSACWRALRSELAPAIMRVNNVAVNRKQLVERVESGRQADTEAAQTQKTLAFYEVLDERLDRVETELTRFEVLHILALETQRFDDDVRQNDIPQAERRYVRMPQLRWIRLADREIEGAEDRDDIEQLTRRARQYLDVSQPNFGGCGS